MRSVVSKCSLPGPTLTPAPTRALPTSSSRHGPAGGNILTLFVVLVIYFNYVLFEPYMGVLLYAYLRV